MTECRYLKTDCRKLGEVSPLATLAMTGCRYPKQIVANLARFHLGEVSLWVSPLAALAMTRGQRRGSYNRKIRLLRQAVAIAGTKLIGVFGSSFSVVSSQASSSASN